MILRARTVVPMSGPPIDNGAVAVDDNTVVGVGPLDDVLALDPGPLLDLGEVALMPGLINAHCHLDYSMMRYAISPPKSFTAWVQRINALKRSLHDDEYLAAIQRGFRELQKWGTTTVCNMEAFPALMGRIGEPPIRTWWFYEMIDVRHRTPTDDVVFGALSFFQHRPESLSRFGLNPHAPYTASEGLFAMANACAMMQRMLLTAHIAESREEAEMFRDARGQLYDFMRSLGRPMEDCGNGSPFSRLWRSRAIDGKWILVHMNELSEEDFALLASIPREGLPHIVHCPGSHAYFGHSRFRFRRLRSLGVNISLGTDSLASTNSLSLLEEVRRLSRNEPWLEPRELLETVTLNPARALKREGLLGSIQPGALADLIALPATGRLKCIYEEIVHFRNTIPWMMIDGKIRSSFL